MVNLDFLKGKCIRFDSLTKEQQDAIRQKVREQREEERLKELNSGDKLQDGCKKT